MDRTSLGERGLVVDRDLEDIECLRLRAPAPRDHAASAGFTRKAASR